MSLKYKFIKLCAVSAVLVASILPNVAQAQQDGMMGEIKLFAGNFAPRNWAFCEGQLLSISQNSALFSILGTTYGGDGRTTFSLPDLRGRVPVGVGHGPGLNSVRSGQKQGKETITLQQVNLPEVSSSDANVVTDVTYTSLTARAGPQQINSILDVTKSTISAATTGSGVPINIKQPSLGLHYIIALQGIYPSRN